jgi:hypothetical protein
MTKEPIVKPTEAEVEPVFKPVTVGGGVVTDTAELKVKLLNAEAEAQYWRDRCAQFEAHHERIAQAAAEIRGRVEQFFVVLQAVRPQGTERRAGE